MTDNKKKIVSIILAAGSGSRMSSDKTKQTMLICGKTVLQRSVEAFENTPSVDSIIIVCRDGEEEFAASCAASCAKVEKIVVGGSTRAESAKRGFEALDNSFDGIVLIHDAARCLIASDDIERVASKASLCGAAIASCSITDTIKRIDNSGNIEGTVDRDNLISVQTPQGFSSDIYRLALLKNSELSASITDDASLMESIGVKVACVATSKSNIKITTPEDITLAEFIINSRYAE